jgi:hypothetical protein
MEQSILTSTKKILGVADADTSFDQDIITHINTAFSHLHQLGIGPVAGFVIEDENPEWDDFFQGAPTPIESAAKTNVYLRVRMLFDPPDMQHVMQALKEQLLESDVRLSNMREELEWFLPIPVPPIIDGGEGP